MPILDRWILERLNAVIRETLKAYEAYDFRKAFSVINQFCTSDLSALYVDTTKDRLYCDSVTSVRRRATHDGHDHHLQGPVPPAGPHPGLYGGRSLGIRRLRRQCA